MASEVLDEAYVRLHRWGPEWGGENGLSNHGPMAAEVLSRRGFDDQVGSWLDRYVARLETLPGEDDPITEDNWAEAMGQLRRVGDWIAFFQRAGSEAPWTEVLAAWWPRLLPAIASGATHGLIRTGHAVRTVLGGDTSPGAVDEIAHALGYWAARAIFVPGLAAPAGDLDAPAALAALPRLPEQSGVIRDRFARLADLPAWTPSLTTLRSPGTPAEVPAALASLVEAGVRQYATHGYGSPVLLVHVATAPNAMGHLLPALPQSLWPSSFAATWAACAAITVAYAPADPRPILTAPASGPGPAPDPADLMARATEHGDEHVIKLTDTALDAYARTADPALLTAASGCADLIDPPR
jgi:Questin oxidase-like